MLITLILNIYTLISKCLNHYLTIAMKNTIYLRHAFHKRINTCIVEDFDLNIDRRIILTQIFCGISRDHRESL